MTIIDYNNSTDVKIQFEDGSIKKCEYSKFKKGLVKSKYDKTVFNIGYLGEGNTKEKIQIIWRDMILRCYSDKKQEKFPTYKNCIVCEEWHNYQNFAKWFEENYYEIEGEIMCLDKDILVKGNKIYSPETCVFVPSKINTLFTKTNKTRGEYPIGVTYNNGKYVSRCEYNGKRKHLGRFNSLEEAFIGYKCFKEKIIKEIADAYKCIIPIKLYKAMYDYVVEITD